MSLIDASTSAGEGLGPTVTQTARRNRRRTAGFQHTCRASVVLPNPPAPTNATSALCDASLVSKATTEFSSPARRIAAPGGCTHTRLPTLARARHASTAAATNVDAQAAPSSHQRKGASANELVVRFQSA